MGSLLASFSTCLPFSTRKAGLQSGQELSRYFRCSGLSLQSTGPAPLAQTTTFPVRDPSCPSPACGRVIQTHPQLLCHGSWHLKQLSEAMFGTPTLAFFLS